MPQSYDKKIIVQNKSAIYGSSICEFGTFLSKQVDRIVVWHSICYASK